MISLAIHSNKLLKHRELLVICDVELCIVMSPQQNDLQESLVNDAN